MPFDLTACLGTMTRVVADAERDGERTKVITATRRYDTDAPDLWHALTDPERIPRWFLPISGDLKLGGRYQLEGNAGGAITACDPPKHLALTWEFGGDTSWVTVDVAPEAGGARLTLRHESRVDPAFWSTYGPGATGVGWELGLLGLARYLAGPAHVLTSEENTAWMASPEAKAFVADLSAAWAEADVAHGEAPEQAAAAAESTRRFYTGEKPGG